MTHAGTILFFALLNMILGCAHGLEATNEAYGQAYKMATGAAGAGKLTGKVMRAPTSPVGRIGVPSPSEPAANVKLVITTLAGQEFASVVTDEQGVFSISLPPDTYRVETTALSGMEFTKDLPATVVITEGRKTRLDIHIDTGIR